MPKPSEKCQLEQLVLYCAADDDLELEDEEGSLLILSLLESQRYTIPRSTVPKSFEWWETVCSNFSDNLFRNQLRMNRAAFHHLIFLISGHEIFKNTHEHIGLQTAVTLYRLGTFGNSSSINHVATKFGISFGSVVLFTDRVIEAIISLTKKYVYWPSSTERKEIGLNMAFYGLPKCVGFVDGTDIIFCDAPLDKKEFYWSRKKKYCMQAQIICDPNMRIRDLFVGYPGSVHDAKVFGSSPIGQHSSQFFSSGEFIIGDSAYALTENVIVPYKRGMQGLSQDKKAFNRHVSSHRVGVENTIGLLKGRFQSLKGLRIRISVDSGHEKACSWVHACVILHNILLEQDPWEEIQMQVEDVDVPNQNDTQQEKSRRGNLKRAALFEIFKALHRNDA